MHFKVASASSKTITTGWLVAFAILATSSVGASAASPAAGGTVAASADVDPSIFHHWPHDALAAKTEVGPDIFHHWPHLTVRSLDDDASPDIFHHWPHDAK